MEQKPIPETLIECFLLMEEEVAAKDVEDFKNVVNADFHPLDHNMGWGLYIRNRFLHPLDSPIRRKFKDLGIWFEPDSISGLIRKMFWAYLNGEKPAAQAMKEAMDKRVRSWPHGSQVEIDLEKIEDLIGKYEP